MMRKLRKPDYTQLLKVLNKQVPDRPTLYEFLTNWHIDRVLVSDIAKKNDGFDDLRISIQAFKAAGYDYVSLPGSDFKFETKKRDHIKTQSLNDADSISDWESYEKYEWPNPENFDNKILDMATEEMPEGMGIVVHGNCGVFENVIALVGFDNLCMMLFDEPDLVQQIFNDVGSRFVKYYDQAAQHPGVIAVMSNDDWGFNTATMLSPKDMRKYVIPWHKKIVETCHKHNKPTILHSCGQLDEVMDDIVNDIKYDAKHSYQDAIRPVEEAYEKYKGQIAVLGGIDVDFMARSTPKEIEKRCRAMIERTTKDGGYALGTGNSVPDFIPHENYFAMIDTVRFGDI